MSCKLTQDNNGNFRKKSSILILFVILSIFYSQFNQYKQLPNDFPQPFKYRLLCFGADIINYIGSLVEYLNIGHRVDLTRLAYHLTVGSFSIRNQNDQIEIINELIDDVPIRIFKPQRNTTDKQSVIFYYHGGGYFLGSADIFEPVTYLLAKYTKCIVIYIEFRLIPDYKYPAALNDSLLTTKYILERHNHYNIDLNNVILAGDSAGGNLATVINRKLIENKIVIPKLKVLIYPILQFFDFTLPSYQENLPKRILGNIDHENLKNFIQYFTGIHVDDTIFSNGHSSKTEKESSLSKYVNKNLLPNKFLENLNFIQQTNSTISSKLKEILFHADVSPLLVDDYCLKETSSLNTYVLTAGHDILRDDGFMYVKRLQTLGLNVKHEHFESVFHGVFGLLHGPLKFDISHQLMDSVVNHINFIIDE